MYGLRPPGFFDTLMPEISLLAETIESSGTGNQPESFIISGESESESNANPASARVVLQVNADRFYGLDSNSMPLVMEDIAQINDPDPDKDGWTTDDAFPDDYREWRNTDASSEETPVGDNNDIDIDGDGFSNRQEMLSGSDPRSASSVPTNTGNTGSGDIDNGSDNTGRVLNPYTDITDFYHDITVGWITLGCGTSYELGDKTHSLRVKSLNEPIDTASARLFQLTSSQGNIFDIMSVSGISQVNIPESTVSVTESEGVYSVDCAQINIGERTPVSYLNEAIATFQGASVRFEDFILNGDLSASWEVAFDYFSYGFSETINAISGVTSLRGNDELIKGLRHRFDSDGSSESKTQQELLNNSRNTFELFLGKLSDPVRKNFLIEREKLRANDLLTNLNGKTVSGDIYRYTDAVVKYGVAALSEAKQLFYKDNVTDVDNPPRNNFPGPEDLDIDNDGELNGAGRDVAAQKAKSAGNQLYLHSLSLIAGQTENQFNDNIGYEVKRQLVDANQLYRDIKSGFNPQQLAGDFVPYQPVEHFLSQANDLVIRAVRSEAEAKRSAQKRAENETALNSELRTLKERYRDRIAVIAGVSVSDGDVATYADRKEFIDSITRSESPGGEIGAQVLSLREAYLTADEINQDIQNSVARIAIEQGRNRKTTNLIISTAQKQSALTASIELLKCCIVGTFNSYDPNSAGRAALKEIEARIQAIQRAELDDIRSDATVKNILLEQASLELAFNRSVKAIERQALVLDNMIADLERTLVNYARAVKDLDESYLNDPAYRVEATNAEQYANDAFEAATEASYIAAKALEYQWSEKFNNPVLRLDGGLASPLAVVYDPFTRAESVFSAQFANGASPSLEDYLSGLKAWDVRMRQLRYPEHQSATVRFSMRDDILGFGVYDDDVAERRFRNFIEENRIPGTNPDNDDLEFRFGMDIVTERLFPDLPNIKIDSISVNLVSDSSGSVRRNARSDAAIVDLVMLDRAYIRTFFANYPEQDDILSYELQEGRTIDKSPFLASVSATIDGYAAPLPVNNTQLANHSPAASIWVLRMKNNRFNNRDLDLEHLSDIQIQISYSYGKPRAIRFP